MKHPNAAAHYSYWYAKLLSLYPKPYRKRFSESMQQTFNDLCREQEKTGNGMFRLIVWTFAETSVGIIKERIPYMKNSNKPLILSAVAGLCAVLPFMAMELITASDKPRSNFGLPLFIVMWLLAVLFIYMLMSVVRSLQTRQKSKISPAVVGFKIVALALIAWSWVGLVVDQMPCFLGAGGC